ncbi:hypothetical protein RIE95_05870 [Acidithiobacillus thiooxidans]|uniref:hypothetical protein n=1 Tax=Acidithiobacillus thiooxidans TaxID=930 RepID=UPI00285E62C7|nr:hypothetical protein [Acidithiobacillus thiooxidans]MDR7926519.1 hypothetical protein [Acidithiobacillus thiooxidans]
MEDRNAVKPRVIAHSVPSPNMQALAVSRLLRVLVVWSWLELLSRPVARDRLQLLLLPASQAAVTLRLLPLVWH